MNSASSSVPEGLPVFPEPPRSGELAGTPLSPMILRSQHAFRARLPELLKTKTDERAWVAFCSDKLIAFGPTKTEVYQECLRRGLARGTFVVRRIEPAASCDDVEIFTDP